MPSLEAELFAIAGIAGIAACAGAARLAVF